MQRKPIVVSAAGAGTVNVRCRVRGISWVGGTTIGHKVEIQDPSDNAVLWAAEANSASYDERDFLPRFWPNGFKVPTLDSGKLYIDIE